jgi:hypothetical protein
MSDPRAVPSLGDLEGASWAALLAGPFAWFIDQQASYRLAIWACGGGSTLVLHLVNLLALIVAASGAVVGYRRWRERAPVSDELDQAASHAGFLSLLGLTLSGFSVLPILAQIIAVFILDPCQQ